MNRAQLKAEINRVETALQNTTSKKLQRDYGKHLKRLRSQLRYYDRSMEQWQARIT